MKFKHAVRVRVAATALAATLALGVVASPAPAQVRVSVGPSVHDPTAHSDLTAGVEPRTERLRGRYQLRLHEARKLVRA